jgi:hypothetical protein
VSAQLLRLLCAWCLVRLHASKGSLQRLAGGCDSSACACHSIRYTAAGTASAAAAAVVT